MGGAALCRTQSRAGGNRGHGGSLDLVERRRALRRHHPRPYAGHFRLMRGCLEGEIILPDQPSDPLAVRAPALPAG